MAKLSGGQIATAAKLAGFTGSDLVTAIAVAMAESGGDPAQATHEPNGTTSYGVWQINSVHTDVLGMGDWSNPFINAQMAFKIHATQGWHPWSTYNSGAYLPFVFFAKNAADNPEIISNWPGPIAGVVQGASNAANQLGLADIAKAVVGAFKLLGQAALWLVDPGNWIRIAKFGIGGVLIVAGLNIVAKPVLEPVVDKATKTATMARR